MRHQTQGRSHGDSVMTSLRELRRIEEERLAMARAEEAREREAERARIEAEQRAREDEAREAARREQEEERRRQAEQAEALRREELQARLRIEAEARRTRVEGELALEREKLLALAEDRRQRNPAGRMSWVLGLLGLFGLGLLGFMVHTQQQDLDLMSQKLAQAHVRGRQQQSEARRQIEAQTAEVAILKQRLAALQHTPVSASAPLAQAASEEAPRKHRPGSPAARPRPVPGPAPAAQVIPQSCLTDPDPIGCINRK